MLKMTKGDLTKENIVSCLAEEFGDAIHKNDHNPKTDNMQYLRNAINFFKQKPFKEMPYIDKKNNDTVLGLEPHSYSRLYLGACYDVLAGLYSKFKKSDNFDDQKLALIRARDVFAKDFARALDFSPVGEISFKDMALAMIKADIIDNGGANRDVIEKVFIDRKILTPGVIKNLDTRMASLPDLDLPSTITSPADLQKFIDENKGKLHIPSFVDLKLVEAYLNDKGEKHVNFIYDNYIILKGPQFGPYAGQAANIMGSVCLTFNKDGKLIDCTTKKITPKVKENVLYSLEFIIKAIMQQQAAKRTGGSNSSPDKFSSYISGDSSLSTMMVGEDSMLSLPTLYSKKSELGDITVLAKQAVISDPIDYTKRGAKALGEYFTKLKKHLETNNS